MIEKKGNAHVTPMEFEIWRKQWPTNISSLRDWNQWWGGIWIIETNTTSSVPNTIWDGEKKAVGHWQLLGKIKGCRSTNTNIPPRWGFPFFRSTPFSQGVALGYFIPARWAEPQIN